MKKYKLVRGFDGWKKEEYYYVAVKTSFFSAYSNVGNKYFSTPEQAYEEFNRLQDINSRMEQLTLKLNNKSTGGELTIKEDEG